MIPIFLALSLKYSNKVSLDSEKTLNSMKKTKHYVTDVYQLSKEDRYLDHKQLSTFDKQISNYEQSHKKSTKTRAFFDNIISFGTLNFLITLVLLTAGYLVFRDKVTIGTLIALQLYVSQLWNPLEFIFSYRGEYLSVEPIIKDFSNMLNIPTIKYENNHLSSVSLTKYQGIDNEGNHLGNPLDIELTLGNKYLVLGENGSGKTTLIESILSLTNRFEGQISMIPIQDSTSSDFVYVPSNPYISSFFDENIHNGSTGQKKIAQIMNSILTKKTFYIFDEPTNYLDTSNKKLIVDKINALGSQDTIILVISHDACFLDSEEYIKIKIERSVE
jgi:ABC-type bacteriocin/lantibiotic exporter with double-glycine peptidase domain